MLSPENLDALMAMTLWLSAVSTFGSLHVGSSGGVETDCTHIMLDLTGCFEATTRLNVLTQLAWSMGPILAGVRGVHYDQGQASAEGR